jgi:hypothetical protein
VQGVPFKTQPWLLLMNPFTHKTKPTAILNSCSHIPLLHLMDYSKSVRPQFQLFRRSISNCHRRIYHMCPEVLLPTGVLLSYSLHFFVRIRIPKRFTDSSKNLDVVIIFENEHMIFSHLHSFCAGGVSSGLATRVTLTRVSCGSMGESIIRGWTCFWFNSCAVVRDCCRVTF